MKKRSTQKVESLALFGDIDTEALDIIKSIISIGISSPEALINLHLCTGGGEYEVATAIFDAIQASPNEVHIYGTGKIYSAGMLILQAGDKRFLTPNSKLMMHFGSAHMSENALTKAKIQALDAYVSDSDMKYVELIGERSGVDLDVLAEMCEQERYFDAKEAVELGLADEIFYA